MLRANDELIACVIIWPQKENEQIETDPDEPAKIDPFKQAEEWKSDLVKKYGIAENRFALIPAVGNESKVGTFEVWLVPPGTPLPDPYASTETQLGR